MNRLSIALAIIATTTIDFSARAAQPVPSWGQLTTGNGFGFSVFDTNAKEVNQFLERPYRYLRPGANLQATGVERRNLAYDVYFGARVNGVGSWLRDIAQTSAGYVSQSGVINSKATLNGVDFQSFYFAPFGYSGNALVMVVQATNNSASAATVDVFANPNFHMGTATDPQNPGTDGEMIATQNGSSVETGNGGGAMVYMPIGGFDKADCSGTGYNNVKAGMDLAGTPQNCSGTDLTIDFQKSLGSLPPGQSAYWGLAIVFVSDANSASAVQSWNAFLSGRAADKVLSDAESEWEQWRKPPPAILSDAEKRVFRQAESTLRMSQVLEPWQDTPKQKGYGMLLASLPPGQWHIGWVRDAQYATVALARMGHYDEARRALEFFLDADAGNYQQYVGVPYRISVTRYFGNGEEESDWNQDGPNIEFDGFGTYLWAARAYVDSSGDTAWLMGQTRAGENVYTVLQQLIATPIEFNIEKSTGVMSQDTSIWESHWNQRKHYTYTSLAAARGLCDFASLAERSGDSASAAHYAKVAGALPGAIRAHMVDSSLYLGGSIEGLQSGHYHDGAALEAINWSLYPPDDPLSTALLNGISKLQVGDGGYMRNDDGLSSYDSNEWIFIDLRAQSALRLAGRAQPADALLAWITAQGEANYDLLPELFNQFAPDGPIDSFTGAVPMVGFGAAAYINAQLDRAGVGSLDTACTQSGAADGGADGGSGNPKSGGCDYAPHSPAPSLFVSLLFIVAIIRIRNRHASM